MEDQKFAIAIMAAGKGTRLKSSRPKVLHEIGGKPLLIHVIRAALKIVSPDQIYCIVGHEAAKVQAAVGSTGVKFVLQPEQRGTGHALQMVKAFFASSDEPLPRDLLVLSGDVPLIRPETIESIRRFHQEQDAAMTILTAVPENPTGYGRVLRAGPEDSPEVAAIVEQKSLRPDQLEAPEINSGIYCFNTSALFKKLDLLTTDNAHGEFYLTDIAAMLVADGERVVALKADNVDEVLGANTIAEMMHLDAAMRMNTARRLMAAGVTIFRPETCVIDGEVEVAPDTVIEPFVQLLGQTRIGADSRIRSYSVIEDTVIGNRVTVRNGCIMASATISDEAIIGPYSHLRPESNIGEKVHIGNFVETKKVTIGQGSKANHLNYLGDAVIGEGVNIGAGAITCNYDGANKHQTTIGDHVFVGSDSTLVAPVKIESDSYIAAGSTITETVPNGALALGRARQVVKPDWVAKKQAERAAKKG